MRRFYGEAPARSFRARVAEMDGEIVGLVGWYVERGRAYVFSEVREPLRRFPRVIWREARTVMDAMRVPAVCVADKDEPGAERMLRRLGWRHVGSTRDGEAYAWRS